MIDLRAEQGPRIGGRIGRQTGRNAAPQILILATAVGTGHLRCAQAVELALRQLCPDAYIENVDILQLSIPPFRRCYGGLYLDFVDKAPQVLGFFYNLMDRRKPGGPDYWDYLRVRLERMSMRLLVRLLESRPWDLVINTHFLSAEIVSLLRREGRIHVPQVTITTDFETHRLWVNHPCEKYFTATDEAADYLGCFGVPRRDAITTGIPIHPVFGEPKDRDECRARHGFRRDRPLVLLLSGGHGRGAVEDVYRALLDIDEETEIAVVTGHNRRLRRRLEAIRAPGRHRSHILGFTEVMDELLTAADLVVSKPGGLTTAEILARGTALAIVHPIPGQEERNSDYLLENGAAVKINHLPTLPQKLSALLHDRDQLARLQTNARRLARPRAALDVVENCLALLAPASSSDLP